MFACSLLSENMARRVRSVGSSVVEFWIGAGDVHHARINDNRPAYALTEADGEQPKQDPFYPHVEHADLVFSAIMEADAVLYGSDAERDERYHHALLDAADPAFGRHDYVASTKG